MARAGAGRRGAARRPATPRSLPPPAPGGASTRRAGAAGAGVRAPRLTSPTWPEGSTGRGGSAPREWRTQIPWTYIPTPVYACQGTLVAGRSRRWARLSAARLATTWAPRESATHGPADAREV